MGEGLGLTELGVAAACVIFILDRVFSFILQWKKGENGTTAGNKSPEYWFTANRRAAQEAIDMAVIPVMKQQAEILSRIEARTGLMHELMLKHGFVLDDVQKSLDRLRVTSHEIANRVQRLSDE